MVSGIISSSTESPRYAFITMSPLAGLTQEEMAENINVSQTFFANIERGKRGASFETVELLSKCFNIPYFALFEDTENTNSSDDEFINNSVKDLSFYKNLENKLEKYLKEAIHNCLQKEEKKINSKI